MGIIDNEALHPGRCTHYIAADGSELELTDAIRKSYMKKVDALSSQALRVMGIATRRNVPFATFGAEGLDTDDKFKNIVTGLTLCGLCASIDPERDGVKGAVKTAKTAGLRVVMITGDYLPTAIAIAKNINIIHKSADEDVVAKEACDCGKLREGDVYLPDEAIDKLSRSSNVFARAKPEDKLEIVKSLQRQGWVCAMTGDGVNDAPALQRADIGVAMGLEGTEVPRAHLIWCSLTTISVPSSKQLNADASSMLASKSLSVSSCLCTLLRCFRFSCALSLACQ